MRTFVFLGMKTSMFPMRYVPIAPLIVFRILWGGLISFACLWSLGKDDITQRFIEPVFFFKYYGFSFVSPFSSEMYYYGLYFIWFVCGICITLGLFYRLCIGLFFVMFTYLQLIDATNFINHYYAISLFSFLMMFLPASADMSLDVSWRKHKRYTTIPIYYVYSLRAMVAIMPAYWA